MHNTCASGPHPWGGQKVVVGRHLESEVVHNLAAHYFGCACLGCVGLPTVSVLPGHHDLAAQVQAVQLSQASSLIAQGCPSYSKAGLVRAGKRTSLSRPSNKQSLAAKSAKLRTATPELGKEPASDNAHS